MGRPRVEKMMKTCLVIYVFFCNLPYLLLRYVSGSSLVAFFFNEVHKFYCVISHIDVKSSKMVSTAVV